MSRMIAVGRALLTAGMLVVYGACGVVEAQPARDVLRQRLLKYEQSWKNHDLKSVWELMSRRLQEGNDNDPRKFEASVRQAGLWISRIRTLNVVVTGDRAKVRESVTYASSSGKKVGEEQEESDWVFAEGHWFLDEYRTLEAK